MATPRRTAARSARRPCLIGFRSAVVAIQRAEVLKKAEKLLRTGKLDLAIAEYVRLIEEQPRDWNTRNTLGDLYVRANKPAEAIEHAQKAVDLEPKSAELQALLALAFDWSGNSDRALTSARRATELDPKLPEGWAYLAEAEADKFRLREASDSLDRAAAVGHARRLHLLPGLPTFDGVDVDGGGSRAEGRAELDGVGAFGAANEQVAHLDVRQQAVVGDVDGRGAGEADVLVACGLSRAADSAEDGLADAERLSVDQH